MASMASYFLLFLFVFVMFSSPAGGPQSPRIDGNEPRYNLVSPLSADWVDSSLASNKQVQNVDWQARCPARSLKALFSKEVFPTCPKNDHGALSLYTFKKTDLPDTRTQANDRNQVTSGCAKEGSSVSPAMQIHMELERLEAATQKLNPDRIGNIDSSKCFNCSYFSAMTEHCFKSASFHTLIMPRHTQ